MARRRQQQRNGSAPRRGVPAITEQLREEQRKGMGKKEVPGGRGKRPEWMEELFHRGREVNKVLDNNPRHAELRQQKVRLHENGVTMEWGEAQKWVESLRRIQAKPLLADAWSSLLALVKPRGAETLPVTVSSTGIVGLRSMGMVDEGSAVDSVCARVLEASFTLTKDGQVVLRDPVSYTPEFVAQWATVDQKVQSDLEQLEDRLAAEKADKEVRRKGDRGEGRAH